MKQHAVTEFASEDWENFRAYGRCRVCGAPRQSYREEHDEDGTTVVTWGIRCSWYDHGGSVDGNEEGE